MKNDFIIGIATGLFTILIILSCIFLFLPKTTTTNIQVAEEITTEMATPRSSLTFSEIRNMNRPYGAMFESWSNNDTIKSTGRILYAEHGYIFNKNLSLMRAESSSIEDGKIYTSCHCYDEDGKECDVLFIHDPNTLDWVAASIEYTDGTHSLYTFFDKDGKTVYEKENK